MKCSSFVISSKLLRNSLHSTNCGHPTPHYITCSNEDKIPYRTHVIGHDMPGAFRIRKNFNSQRDIISYIISYINKHVTLVILQRQIRPLDHFRRVTQPLPQGGKDVDLPVSSSARSIPSLLLSLLSLILPKTRGNLNYRLTFSCRNRSRKAQLLTSLNNFTSAARTAAVLQNLILMQVIMCCQEGRRSITTGR